MLKQAYAPLLQCDRARWSCQPESWEKFDHEAHSIPAVGRCVFLTYDGADLVGFGSFDPRNIPAHGIVGHHCILPAYQGRGLGRSQLDEILKRLQGLGARNTHVSTLDIPFFAPARRLYESAGFHLSGHNPWPACPEFDQLHFQKEMPEISAQPIQDCMTGLAPWHINPL